MRSLFLFGASASLSFASQPVVLPLTRATARVPAGAPRAPREFGHASRVARRAQDEFPVYGDYRDLAYYYADIFIGSGRQKFTVIADTGSSLTEVPCVGCGNCGTHINSARFDPASSSTCVALVCSDTCPGGAGCNRDTNQCTYSQSYAEGSSISGIMLRDRVYLGGDGDGTVAAPTSGYAVDFNFGCGKSEGGLFNAQDADGIMGLGMGGLSMTLALWANPAVKKRFFSMCLSFVGGAMTFGMIEERMHKAPVAWANLQASGFYVVTVSGWALSGQEVNAGGFNAPHTIVDSGTTFTYVPSVAFNSLLVAIDNYCSQAGKCVGSSRHIEQESRCWNLASPADLNTFPSISIKLSGWGGASDVNVPIAPAHLFINMGWDQGAYCLGVYDNGNGGGVLGGNAMMGHDVIFDLESTRIGFAESDCVLDPSWIVPAGDPSATPTPTPTGSDTGTASNTPSTTPTPSTTASNGTVPMDAGDGSLGPANHLPSVSLLIGDAAFVNAAVGLCFVAAVVGLCFCFIRRRGCEVRIGSLVFKIDGPSAGGLAYSRVGAPSSVPMSAAKSTKKSAQKAAQKGAIGADIIVEAEEETDDEDLDLEDFSPAESKSGLRPGAAVRTVSV